VVLSVLLQDPHRGVVDTHCDRTYPDYTLLRDKVASGKQAVHIKDDMHWVALRVLQRWCEKMRRWHEVLKVKKGDHHWIDLRQEYW
jgi:hypothetical protein